MSDWQTAEMLSVFLPVRMSSRMDDICGAGAGFLFSLPYGQGAAEVESEVKLV